MTTTMTKPVTTHMHDWEVGIDSRSCSLCGAPRPYGVRVSGSYADDHEGMQEAERLSRQYADRLAEMRDNDGEWSE